MSKHWSQVVTLEDNDSRRDPANMICEAEPGSTPGQDRDGTAQANCFDWLYFWWRKKAMSKRHVTYVKDWHLTVTSLPLWCLQRALNDWFSVDAYPFCGFKVQGMNPALWAKRYWRNLCLSQCCPDGERDGGLSSNSPRNVQSCKNSEPIWEPSAINNIGNSEITAGRFTFKCFS